MIPKPYYEDAHVTLYCGDCVATMKPMPDNSVDSIVTDPPYGLGFMGKGWDATVPGVEVWIECLRILKPGGHLLAFAGTRTQHRMACAIEDAGFEIRDMIAWVYGSGFPKSLSIDKAIDKMDATDARRDRQLKFTEWMRGTGLTQARIDELTDTNMGGHYLTAASQPSVATRNLFETLRPHFACDVPEWVEQMVNERTVESENFKRREVVGTGSGAISTRKELRHDRGTVWGADSSEFSITAPATEAARQWSGWGTALKPSLETVTWARKPLLPETERRTILSNLLQLEARLWLLFDVSAADQISASSQSEFVAACDIAQWTAEDVTHIRVGLFGQMDTSQYVSAVTSSLNIVSSWRHTLEENWSDGNTSTTGTESSQTIDLKTLKFSLSQITPESIVRACGLTGGFNANASTAEKYFSDCVSLLQSIRKLSATGLAMSQVQRSLPDETVRPNLDPIVMARKPLIGTVAANVLLYGTGGINVDACRVGTDGGTRLENMTAGNDGRNLYGKGVNAGAFSDVVAVLGRWPANLIHDGSDEVLALFPESGSGKASERGSGKGKTETFGIYGGESTIRGHDDNGGSAARFFYTAKADSSERRQSKHPTVKPLDLIRYLVRMVTPIGGVVLDPFLGSGTLCEAARAEHCRSIGIELDEAYCADAVERLRQGVLF